MHSIFGIALYIINQPINVVNWDTVSSPELANHYHRYFSVEVDLK